MRGSASGTLYVVATPIGNLEDVTLRALRVLRDVEVIAAEDTRRTAHLLQHYSISTPTTSLHEHNERQKLPLFLDRLRQGASVALVSDAGTPTISDPGARLVQAARQAGTRVEPVPGPSAVTAALAISGLPCETFIFAGFAPLRSQARETWLRNISASTSPVVLFEAPHRIRALLEAIQSVFGKRPIIVAREISKLHEETSYGDASEMLRRLDRPRGEFTIVISPEPKDSIGHMTMLDAKLVAAEHGQLTYDGLSRRQAIKELAMKYDVTAKRIFNELEASKPIGRTP